MDSDDDDFRGIYLSAAAQAINEKVAAADDQQVALGRRHLLREVGVLRRPTGVAPSASGQVGGPRSPVATHSATVVTALDSGSLNASNAYSEPAASPRTATLRRHVEALKAKANEAAKAD